MSEPAVTSAQRRADEECLATLGSMMEDMKRLEDLMRKDRDEIDYLRSETARLEGETRAVLTRLKEAL